MNDPERERAMDTYPQRTQRPVLDLSGIEAASEARSHERTVPTGIAAAVVVLAVIAFILGFTLGAWLA